MSDIIQTKFCPKCKSVKPVSEFYKNHCTKDGYYGWCKFCTRIKDKNRWQNLSAQTKKKYKQKYRQTNRFFELQKEYAKKYREKHPNQIRAQWAIHSLARNGKLSNPKILKCVYCGRQATQYHHWKGYSPEHWLDVVPACKLCDIKQHKLYVP